MEKPLYLTKDLSLISRQVNGEITLNGVDLNDLLDNISTDALIPSSHCYQDANPQRLGKYLLTGLPEQTIPDNGVISQTFTSIVAGKSFGRGSSREHAQLALIGAGIGNLYLRSSERIFRENCINYGIPVFPYESTTVRSSLSSGKRPNIEHFLSQLPPISQMVVHSGGLLPFLLSDALAKNLSMEAQANLRPMTMAEKIIAAHCSAKFVEPGQQVICKVDRGYAYELQSIVSQSILDKYLPGADIPSPEKFILFEDHLALLTGPQGENLRIKQRQMGGRYNLKSYNLHPTLGVEGICHTVMLEKHSLPGELILGNDSHTCTLGAVGALAIGKGATEMAGAMLSEVIILTVPQSIRVELSGQLKEGVTSKDLMLNLLGKDALRRGLVASGRVLEYSGPGLESLNFDEQVVLANMAIEGQAFTGIVAPNKHTFSYLNKTRGIDLNTFRTNAVYSDENAEFFTHIHLNLGEIEAMVSLPGDTQNTIPLSQLPRTPINYAYIGSCTGGKLSDLILAAKVLEGKKIDSDVQMYIQASSRNILEQARRLGLIEIFEGAGAKVLLPGCGACMGAGPGTTKTSEVIVSDTNRNFYGRMGKGDAYLTNPQIVAKSAIKGYISGL